MHICLALKTNSSVIRSNFKFCKNQMFQVFLLRSLLRKRLRCVITIVNRYIKGGINIQFSLFPNLIKTPDQFIRTASCYISYTHISLLIRTPPAKLKSYNIAVSVSRVSLYRLKLSTQ